MLQGALTQVLNGDPGIAAVCVGSGSDEFVRSLSGTMPTIRERIHGTGRVSASDAALTLSACDLLLQPFPDGVTTRRTSIMAEPRQRARGRDHDRSPDRARVGRRPGPSRLPTRDTDAFVAAARTLLAKDDDRAALAARGARGRIESGLRSTTRFAHFEER